MELDTKKRPELRQILVQLGLQPPFPRSNRDLIHLIESSRRRLLEKRQQERIIKSDKQDVKQPQKKDTKKNSRTDDAKKIKNKNTKKKIIVEKLESKSSSSSSSSSKTKTPNLDLIISELDTIQKYYATKISILEDPEAKRKEKKSFLFKSINLRTAIKNLKIKFREKDITNASEAVGIPRVGKETIAKIKEILETKQLEKAVEIRLDPKLEIKKTLMGIYGVGPVKATELIEKDGITSLDQLRKNTSLLHDVQKIGLEYYDDINTRIPKKEMDLHDTYLQQISLKIDPQAKLIIAGSYRREKKDSGDIDILLTHPDYPENLLTRTVEKLKLENYIMATLVSGPNKFHGLSKLDGKRPRRIDFLYCHPKEFPFALLHFTGSGTFNQLLRAKALKMGYSLSEHGIKKNDGTLVKKIFKDEKDILEFLDVAWLHPKDRDQPAHL